MASYEHLHIDGVVRGCPRVRGWEFSLPPPSPPPRLPPRQRATGRGSPAPARALPGFVEHQDIPQLIRALGYALSNEDLNTRLADAGIGETLEFEEYLLLVKALGKRPDRPIMCSACSR